MHRLVLLVVFVALLAVGASGAGVAARTAEAVDLDPRLAGYPELIIRLGADRIEAPARTAAGRTLVIQENHGAEPGHAFVMRIPDDVPEADVRAALAATTALAEETPAWMWLATFVGNPDRAAPNGGRAVALVDLAPGSYIVGDPYRPPTQFARLEVVADPTVAADEGDGPRADVVAAMREMAFDLPATVSASRLVWQVSNVGAAPHEVAIVPVPAEATAEHVEAAIGAALTAEAGGAAFADQAAPAALGPAWADWRPDLVAGVGVTSPTRSVWAQFDLAPGTYAAICFVPDPATGTPHLMLGMTAVFAVTAGAA